MRKILVILAVLALVVTAAVAQTNGVPPGDTIPPGEFPTHLWDMGVAIMVATMIGQFFGFLARSNAKIKNTIAPKVVWVTTLLADLLLVAQQFVDASGITTLVSNNFDNGIMLAGFGALLPVLKLMASACLAVGQTAVLRWIHENGNKPVFGFKSDPALAKK